MKNITKISRLMSAISYHQNLRKRSVQIKHSVIARTFLNFLSQEGLIIGFTVVDNQYIIIYLKYSRSGVPAFTVLQKYTTSTRKIYISVASLKKLNSNLGVYLLATHTGFITGQSALQKNIGGQLLYHVR